MKTQAEVTRRLRPGMPLTEAIIAMSDGKPETVTTVMRLLQFSPERGMKQIILCDKLGIYGQKLHKLLNECCDADLGKFNETMEAFKAKRYSREEIHKRLEQTRGTTFV